MTDTITPERVAELAEAATPGPWYTAGQFVTDRKVSFDERGARHGETPNVVMAACDQSTAALIAAAPAMAALIATQAAEIERLREALKLAANRFDVVVINAIADGQHGYAEALREWRDETRAALEQEGG